MISICYSGNRAYFEGLLMSVLSVAKNTDEQLDIRVLTMDLPEENPNFVGFTSEQIELLDDVVKEKNPNSTVTKVDVTDLYRIHMIHGKNHHTGYTPYALLRLLIEKIGNFPEKMIYLDVDTMCCNNIKELWDVDISEFDVAMAKDYMGRFWIRRSYCNSGVLLMNIKNMIEHDVFNKCIDMVNNTKMVMPDQSALNKYAKKKYLPFKFNEQRKIHPDTVVKHFCKGIIFFLPFGFKIYNIKQWEREKVHKSLKITQFDDIYERVDQLLPKEILVEVPAPQPVSVRNG